MSESTEPKSFIAQLLLTPSQVRQLDYLRYLAPRVFGPEGDKHGMGRAWQQCSTKFTESLDKELVVGELVGTAIPADEASIVHWIPMSSEDQPCTFGSYMITDGESTRFAEWNGIRWESYAFSDIEATHYAELPKKKRSQK